MGGSVVRALDGVTLDPRGRRVRRPARHVGLRQVHAPQPDRRPRSSDLRQPDRLRPRDRRDVARRPEHPPPHERRDDLPVVQPDPDDDRARERRAADDVRRRGARRARGAGEDAARAGRPRRAPGAPAEGAVGRRAAARVDRARAGQRPEDPPGRRADRAISTAGRAQEILALLQGSTPTHGQDGAARHPRRGARLALRPRARSRCSDGRVLAEAAS